MDITFQVTNKNRPTFSDAARMTNRIRNRTY